MKKKNISNIKNNLIKKIPSALIDRNVKIVYV